MKHEKRIWQRIRFGIALLGFFFLTIPITGYAVDFNASVDALKAKFPNGMYWNHVGSAADNVDGYTASPCTLHKTDGIHIQGTNGCTCNHFVNAKHGGRTTQCMGFAYKLGYDVFGDTTWTQCRDNPAANIKVGDIVRIDGYHSVFVISRSGNVITVGEANYPNSCRILWDRSIDLTTVKISYYERADNYNAVINGTMAPPEPGSSDSPAQDASESADSVSTTEEDNTTGWKQAEDGIHFYYLKNGKAVKSQWITLSNKKYYLDAKGYRVTGLYTIGQKTYYFDEKGIRQTKKWVKVNGDDYYVNEDGLVLKSQWLYLGNVKVYVTKDGSVARDELVKIGKNTYYFNSKAKRSKGFKKYNGKYYYCDKNGIIQKKKWITQSGRKYYLQSSGVRAQNKLLKIGKYRYYFGGKGQMTKKKTITYHEKVYKADKYGHCTFVRYEEEETEQ